jgi:RNA polymerase sigma-70 factor (ECF subfamily)
MADTFAAPRMTPQPIPDSDDDATWIARSLAEPSAFRTLFARHHDRVHRYVASRIGPDAAPDVVSDTFLEAFRTRARFDEARGRDAAPWLLGIATRRLSRQRGAELRWHRRREAAARSEPSAMLVQHGPGSADDLGRLDAAAMRGDLLAALSKLRRGERDALCACVLGGLTYEEAARALDVPVGTVRSRIARARQRLRDALATD